MATQVAMQNSGSYSIAQFQSRMIRYGSCSISFLCSVVKPICFPDGTTSGVVIFVVVRNFLIALQMNPCLF